MTDEMLVRAYRPKIYFDQKEPFEISGVGYTVFREKRRSASFPRVIAPQLGGCVIEYAFWYDYDIQHLYELEHIWVYLDADGNVMEAEGSFHGKYLRLVDPSTDRAVVEDGTRVCAYAQPGKHALMAKPELFRLFPGAVSCCMEESGADGISPSDMVKDYFDIPDELQEKSKAYIRAHYSFQPTFCFEQREWSEELLMPWEELLRTIPDRMNAEIKKMEIWEEKEG